MSGVMLVDPEKLSEAPKAFQQYVNEFFIKKKVFGKTVLYAAQVLHWDWSYTGYNSKATGRAPCHSVELMRFKEGLPEGTGLTSWIDKAGDEFLVKFYGVDDYKDSAIDDD